MRIREVWVCKSQAWDVPETCSQAVLGTLGSPVGDLQWNFMFLKGKHL